MLQLDLLKNCISEKDNQERKSDEVWIVEAETKIWECVCEVQWVQRKVIVKCKNQKKTLSKMYRTECVLEMNCLPPQSKIQT